MYRFTIQYYYESFYNGSKYVANGDKTRTAIVYAKNKTAAIKKVKNIDSDFIAIANNGLLAEELKSVFDNK